MSAIVRRRHEHVVHIQLQLVVDDQEPHVIVLPGQGDEVRVASTVMTPFTILRIWICPVLRMVT